MLNLKCHQRMNAIRLLLFYFYVPFGVGTSLYGAPRNMKYGIDDEEECMNDHCRPVACG